MNVPSISTINVSFQNNNQSPTGRQVSRCRHLLDKDYDDLRRFAESAGTGVKGTIMAGSKQPLVMVHRTMPGKECELAGLFRSSSCLLLCSLCASGYERWGRRKQARCRAWDGLGGRR